MLNYHNKGMESNKIIKNNFIKQEDVEDNEIFHNQQPFIKEEENGKTTVS